jgi:RNA polymerase sigma-70 factor, ECF subfamily
MSGRRSSLMDEISTSTALLERHIPGLRHFARALLRGDRERADDLVQDTLERALSHWHQRRIEGDLRGWLYTILHNRFLSDRQRQKRRAAYSALSEIAEDELPGVEGGQDSALEHRDLLRALRTLPVEQQAVLLLIAVEDLSYEQAARVLGVPIGTVMSRLSRGRERLRRCMNGHPAGPQPVAADGARTPSLGWITMFKPAPELPEIVSYAQRIAARPAAGRVRIKDAEFAAAQEPKA